MYADVVMIIADVSGYTRFMVANETELEHSQEIISALLEAIISEVQIPLSDGKTGGRRHLSLRDQRWRHRGTNTRQTQSFLCRVRFEARRAGGGAKVSAEAAARDLHLDFPILGLSTERYDEIGAVKVIAYKPALANA